MTTLYGKTEFSIEEFEKAPLMAKWEARRRRILRLCFTGKNASPAAIGEQLGIPQALVKRVMAQPQFQEDMRAALKLEMTAVLPQAMSTLIEMMLPEKPDGIRMRAAMWMIERSDQLQKEVLGAKKPKALPDEEQIEQMARKIREKRLAALNAQAVDAKVVSDGGQALESIRESGSHHAEGPALLGQQRGDDRCEQPTLPGPVQEREVFEPGAADALGDQCPV